MWDSKKYPVFHEGDKEGLFLRASLLRLNPTDKHISPEDAAYKEYLIDQHEKAAAHHHAHSVAARRGSGEHAAALAAMHGQHYVAHMKKLGLDPNVPNEKVEKMSRNLNLLDKFVPHHADQHVDIKHKK